MADVWGGDSCQTTFQSESFSSDHRLNVFSCSRIKFLAFAEHLEDAKQV